MSSSSELIFNYQRAIQQAARLEEVASEIERKVTRKMSSAEQELQVAWKGDSAARFLRKESALKEDIGKTAQELRSIAQDIRTIAKRIYDADMEALRIAGEG